jgi:PilZ domain
MGNLLILPLAALMQEPRADAYFSDPHTLPVDDEAIAARPRDRRVGMLGSGYRAAIDGRQAALINLSLSGAQLRGPVRFRPDQPTIVKIGWTRDDLLCSAIARVRWVQFEPDASSGEGLYRVGLAFETWDVQRLKAMLNGG